MCRTDFIIDSLAGDQLPIIGFNLASAKSLAPGIFAVLDSLLCSLFSCRFASLNINDSFTVFIYFQGAIFIFLVNYDIILCIFANIIRITELFHNYNIMVIDTISYFDKAVIFSCVIMIYNNIWLFGIIIYCPIWIGINISPLIFIRSFFPFYVIS